VNEFDAAQGTMDHFAVAAKLIGKVVSAKSSGEALAAILSYRKDIRLEVMQAARRTVSGQEAIAHGYAVVPVQMTAAMINAWSGGKTVSSDEVAYRTSFQDAWKRVLYAAPIPATEPK
jgi:hypothetical protein